MRLDTGATMVAAARLYRSLGFREIPAYNEDPVPGTMWFELML
jgi:ribosomal protein S18 acetylase RimI-like enzyme